jgi:hypothetical protein
MHIYIPTYRRTHRQRTWQFLSDYWRQRTTFVCDEQDARILSEQEQGTAEFWISTAKTIAQKRAEIMKKSPHRYILMLDDDLRFCKRTYRDHGSKEYARQFGKPRPGSFTLPNAKPRQVEKSLKSLAKRLASGQYAHAGFGARQGNNTLPNFGYRENTRMIYALGYDLKVVRKVCELGRIETREDMDYTLQLLRAGYRNCINVEMVVDQYYNAVGGARDQRTVESGNRDAERLAALHPGLVKVVERAYKQSVPRKEVVVSWRKAYKHG